MDKVRGRSSTKVHSDRTKVKNAQWEVSLISSVLPIFNTHLLRAVQYLGVGQAAFTIFLVLVIQVGSYELVSSYHKIVKTELLDLGSLV
jgi:hypothetical protein